MGEYAYLWHWSPRSRRHGIKRHGLRMMTWAGNRLCLHAANIDSAESVREHIAQRHDVVPSQLDGWLLRAPGILLGPRSGSFWLVLCDVQGADLRGPFPNVVRAEDVLEHFARST